MGENDRALLIEVSERGKSNTHQIDELKGEIRELKADNKATLKLATSVEMIARDMSHMREDLSEVKQGQQAMSDKVADQFGAVNARVTHIEQKPYREYQETKKEIKSKIVSTVLGVVITALLSILGTMFATGLIGK